MTAPVNNVFTPGLNFQGILQSQQFQEMRMTNNGTGAILYLGLSPIPNADPSLPVWYVLKYDYDINGFINRQQLPDNGPGYTYIWNDVADYFS